MQNLTYDGRMPSENEVRSKRKLFVYNARVVSPSPMTEMLAQIDCHKEKFYSISKEGTLIQIYRTRQNNNRSGEFDST